MLNGIDLFAGIGAASLAMEVCGIRVVLHVENDSARIADLRHYWPHMPIVEDVNDVESIARIVGDDGRGRRRPHIARERAQGGTVDRRPSQGPFLLCAGPPCQPASSAGKRLGSADDRWLWPQTIAVIEAIRPLWCLIEQPPGILSLAESAAIPGVDLGASWSGRTFCEILTALSRIGYEFPTDTEGHPCIPVIPALGVGSPQRRDRLWIICRRRGVGDARLGAGCAQHRKQQVSGRRSGGAGEPSAGACAGEAVGDGECAGSKKRILHRAVQDQEEHGSTKETAVVGGSRTLPDWSGMRLEEGADGEWRAVVPGLRLLAHGTPRRVSRLRGLGNAWVPQVAAEIIEAMMEAERD